MEKVKKIFNFIKGAGLAIIAIVAGIVILFLSVLRPKRSDSSDAEVIKDETESEIKELEKKIEELKKEDAKSETEIRKTAKKASKEKPKPSKSAKESSDKLDQNW